MTDDLLERIEKFRVRYDMTKSAFGEQAVNSSHLLPAMQNGRKPRAATIAKIKDFMERYVAEQRERDMQALDVVRRAGFVSVEIDGVPRLETNTQIDAKTFKRLLAEGLLVPCGDALLGGQSQTYRPAGYAHGS